MRSESQKHLEDQCLTEVDMLAAESVTLKLQDGFVNCKHQSSDTDSHVTQTIQPSSLTLINLETLFKCQKFSVYTIAYIKSLSSTELPKQLKKKKHISHVLGRRRPTEPAALHHFYQRHFHCFWTVVRWAQVNNDPEQGIVLAVKPETHHNQIKTCSTLWALISILDK